MTDIRTLEIRTHSEGVFQIDVPADWKITFSKVNPAAGGYGESMALRVYEADEKQRACFTDVTSFRDVSIPLRRRTKKVTSKSSASRDSKRSTSEQETEVEHEWVREDL